jgi:hypothetical protein
LQNKFLLVLINLRKIAHKKFLKNLFLKLKKSPSLFYLSENKIKMFKLTSIGYQKTRLDEI